jgi:tetratricopeptide (TPR) repeat protein
MTGSLFFTSCASAEVYTGEGEYAMSKYETPAVAEERAKNIALRYAQEQAGVYIESYSHMKNFELLEDEIITIAANVLKFVEKPIIKKTFMEDGDTIKIFVTVKVEIDDKSIEKYLSKSIESRTQVNAQLEELRKANAAQELQIAELKAKIAESPTVQNEQQLTEIFANEDNIFLANQKIEEGWKLYVEKKYDAAAEIFDEAVGLNPQSSQAYMGRGTALAEIGKYRKAFEDLNKSAELNPNNAVSYLNLGATYADLKQYEKAIENYDKALEIKPKYAMAYFNRGVAFYRLGRCEEAIESYTKAIELDPKNEVFYTNRGSAYDESGQYERGIEDFNAAIKINPKYASAYNNRGWAYMNIEKYSQAIESFTQSIKLNPNNSKYYINRAKCYHLMGDEKKSRADLDKYHSLKK